jgi:hypothetical protein
MKRLFISLAILAVFLMFFVSCYYDNEEALYPTLNNTCDTTNVTYSGTIVPLLNNNCTGCHGGSLPSGGILLTNFNSVQTVASSGLLINALNGNGVQIMPPSGSLSACKLTQFRIWIRDGMPNN